MFEIEVQTQTMCVSIEFWETQEVAQFSLCSRVRGGGTATKRVQTRWVPK